MPAKFVRWLTSTGIKKKAEVKKKYERINRQGTYYQIYSKDV